MKMKITSTLLTTLIVAATVSATAQTIVNPSFETPGHSVPNFITLSPGSTAIAGWTVGGAGIDWFTGSFVAFAGLDPSASDGNFKVDLVRGPNEGGSISQILTGLGAGTTYYVAFDIKVDKIQAGTTVTASAGSATTTIDHTVANSWIQHELAFVASGPSATITFAGPASGATDIGVYIDNVRISTTSFFGDSIPLTISIARYAGITIEGTLGKTFRIESRDSLDESDTWSTATTLVLPRSPFLWFDISSSTVGRRFYRAVQIP